MLCLLRRRAKPGAFTGGLGRGARPPLSSAPRRAHPPAAPALPQVVAAACLFLAGKINDQPKHHSRVANKVLIEFFNKDNPQLQRLAAGAPTVDPAHTRHLPPAQLAEARAFWQNL